MARRNGRWYGAATLACAAGAMAVEIPFDDRVLDDAEDQVDSVLAIDFDGDGDTDALTGSELEDRVLLFESDGADPPAFTRRVLIPGAAGLVAFDVADFDGDGDLDVVTATSSDDAVSWHERTPAKTKGDPDVFTRVTIETVSDIGFVRAADADGDGDTDIVYGSLTELGWLENDGSTPPAFTRRALTTSLLLINDARVADLNADGDPDLVATAPLSAGKLAWYESDGLTPPTFTERMITTTLSSPRAVVLADLNRDQVNDLVVVSDTDDTAAWYESDGASPPVFTERIIATDADGARALAAADLDSDGFVDLAIAETAGNRVRWYESDGADPPAFTPRVVPGDPKFMLTTPRDVAIDDLDGDSDPDILAAYAGSDTVLYFANELAPVRNLTLGAVYDTIAAALLAARDDDLIAVAAFRFAEEPAIDFAGVGAILRSSRGIDQPAGGDYTLADGARLRAPLPEGVTLAGQTTAPFAARAVLAGRTLDVTADATLRLDPLSIVVVEAPDGVTSAGTLSVSGASLLAEGPFASAGGVTINGGTIAADGFTSTGTITGSGDFFTAVTNDGEMTINADSLIEQGLTNNGALTIQSGVLTILGELVNNGTIVGETGARSAGARGSEPDGYFVGGDLTLGAASTLTVEPGGSVSVGGSVLAAIDDAARFSLAEAELRLAGLGDEQTLEAMSADAGADADQLTPGPGRFPIGSLVIGATPATVRLVDDADNGHGGAPPAVYARSLTIATGAQLVTGGIPVYYETLDLQGGVDNMNNLIPLGAAPCPADLTGDGMVTSPDLGVLLAAWGGSEPGVDLDGSGAVDSGDLGVLLSAWGPCP